MDAAEHPRAGLAVSGAMHLALFAVLVFGFARAPKFDDAPESIPVETITTSQLNEIMEGEKDAKPAPAPHKAAAAPASPAPQPPTRPEPEPPTPPQPPQPEPPPPEPPPRPEPPPPKPEPPAPQPPQRPAPPKAEPPKPEPPKPEAEDAPSPPTRPRVVKPVETPKPPERPRPERTQEAKSEPSKPDRFKPDEIAKALAHEKPDERPHPHNPAYDPNAIAKMIGQTRTAEAQPASAPSQGLANHHATRMSVSLENALNEWFRDSYKNCWSLPPSNPDGENYVFDVRVTFNPDGSLSGRPVMLNPPRDPQWRAHADSVMRAVARCNPLKVPEQYAPYFDQWRTKVVHFDPSSAEG